jgi:hypothetical protein
MREKEPVKPFHVDADARNSYPKDRSSFDKVTASPPDKVTASPPRPLFSNCEIGTDQW